MLQRCFEALRPARPMVHCITNSVTINDCANVLLAAGARPIMADDPEESAEITAACRALVLNLGMLSPRKLEAMVKSGHQANRMGIPVVLDPVGAGASRLRTETALRLLRDVQFSVIRGNLSEIETLARGHGTTYGVDSADRVTPGNLDACCALVRAFARRTGAVVALSGAVDLVSDGERVYCIRNGHPMMGLVTGTGCQLSCLAGAFAAANPDRPLEAAAAAVCAMGLCGEIAHDRLGPLDGSGSYRTYLMDAVCRLTPEQLEKGARYELR